MAYNTEASTSDAQYITPTKDKQTDSNYAKSSHLRVSKDDMFMILALWMEEFPLEKDSTIFVDGDRCRKVGAVLVLPNDTVWAADCTRDDVHAVASLLIKHHERANGCRMFMSRKPCRTCAKLLVQSKVKEVLYLPLKPEYYLDSEAEPDEEERKNYHMKQVDRLFIANPIAQKTFVPEVEESVLAKKREETKQQDTEVKDLKDKMIKNKYHFDESSSWLKSIEEELPWQAFDVKIKEQVRKRFADFIEWSIRTRILSGRGLQHKFERSRLVSNPNQPFDPTVKDSIYEQAKDNPPSNQDSSDPVSNTTHAEQANDDPPSNQDSSDPVSNTTHAEQAKDNPPSNQDSSDPVSNTTHAEQVKDNPPSNQGSSDPVSNDTHAEQVKDNPPSNQDSFDPVSNDTHAEQAKHFIEMARLLSQRTDDPKTGVGAVIVSYPKMEIVSIGWNGFPRKARYGEFPRASDTDKASENKYPYVIHAEQNALMMRNEKNIEDAILFVTKSPCDECAPLIAKEGIKTVVVDADVKYRKPEEPTQHKALPALGYNAFPKMVEKRKFVSYQTEKIEPPKAPDGSNRPQKKKSESEKNSIDVGDTKRKLTYEGEQESKKVKTTETK